MIREITDVQFNNYVYNNELVLVDFWAPWCGPCKMLAPTLEEVAKELGSKIEFAKMNVDENPKTPSRLGVRSIPTLLLFKNGEQISLRTGVHPKAALIEWLTNI